MWVVGAFADLQIHDLRARHAAAIAEMTAPLAGHDAALAAWWASEGDRTRLFHQSAAPAHPRPTAAAYLLAELIHSVVSDSDDAGVLCHDYLALLAGDFDIAGFVAAARKCSPAAALVYGLGPTASGLMPGRFGNFMLTSREVLDVLPAMESVLDLAGHRREAVRKRIVMWMSGVGDDPDFNASQLISGPLRCIRHAASNGLGLAGLAQWL